MSTDTDRVTPPRPPRACEVHCSKSDFGRPISATSPVVGDSRPRISRRRRASRRAFRPASPSRSTVSRASRKPKTRCGVSGSERSRVRDHGEIARLELVGADLERAATAELRLAIVAALRALGCRWVALDLDGYRQGSGSLPASLDV
jgi:hypothetical protein